MYPEIEAFTQWLHRKSPQASTPRHYQSDLNFFFTWSGAAPDQITVRKVDEFVVYCQTCGYAAATINRRLAALNSFYDFLSLESDQAPKKPVIRKRHLITLDERLPRDVPNTDLQQLFSVIDVPRDRAMFLLMAACGLRVGEVRALSLLDLELDIPSSESLPRLRIHGKGSVQRTVYITGEALQALKEWLEVRPQMTDSAVFLNRSKKRLTVTGIQACLAGYCEKAGLWVTCHQLRHTFARRMVEARVPVTTLQKLMGHAWLCTTQVYVNVSDPEVQEDFRTAAAVIERQTAGKLAVKDGEP